MLITPGAFGLTGDGVASMRWIASAMPAADCAQLMPVGLAARTLSARAPGQTPRMPMPFCGAAATAAVAVPCTSNGAIAPVVENRVSWVHSGCVGSACVSTRAISGLLRVTGGGLMLGDTTTDRQALGVLDSGSSVTLSVLACAYTSRWRERSAAANARARARDTK